MNPEKEAVQKDIDTYGALAALANTEGGQHLVKTYQEDLRAIVATVTAGYATLPETQLRAELARAGVILNTLNAIHRAPQNYADATEYAKSLESTQ